MSGFIINKFRGDPRCSPRACARSGSAPAGAASACVPLLAGRRASAGRGRGRRCSGRRGRRPVARLSIVVPPAAAHRQLRRLRSAARGARRRSACSCSPATPLPGDADLVILPGTKATIADLAALRDAGLGHRPRAPRAPRRPRARDLRRLPDARPPRHRPDGIEGPPGEVEGLRPTRRRNKRSPTRGRLRRLRRRAHRDRRTSTATRSTSAQTAVIPARPFRASLPNSSTGATVVAPRTDRGAYVHGLLADDRQRAAGSRRLGTTASELEPRSRRSRRHSTPRGPLRGASRSRPPSHPVAMRSAADAAADGSRLDHGRRAGTARAPGGCRFGAGLAAAVSHPGRRPPACRHRRAVPPGRGPARPPWRPPASRRWASGAARRLAGRRGERPWPTPLGSTPPPARARAPPVATPAVDPVVEPRRGPAITPRAGACGARPCCRPC